MKAVYVLLLLYGFICTWRMHGAYAEVRKLPAGTVIKVDEGPDLLLQETHYLFDRKMTETAVALANGLKMASDELELCNQRLQDELRKTQSQTPAWKTGIKWFAIGTAVAGAFVAGIFVAGGA